jgi:hypothetical protein
MEKYIEMETFVSNNCIDIKEINLFELLIQENEIKTIYYGKRTARNTEGGCFLIIIDSIFYVFTYHSKYGLYKNITDYKNAVENNYLNAMTYYSCYELHREYTDFNEHILKEYQIDETEIMEYQEQFEKNYIYNNKKNDSKNFNNENEFFYSYISQKNYFFDYIGIINEIEKIKVKYNLKNNQQSIIAWIILNNVNKKEINPNKPNNLIEMCRQGINIVDKRILDYRIMDSALYLSLSSEYRNEYLQDENKFIIEIKEILFKLNDISIVNNEELNGNEYNDYDGDGEYF